MSDSYIVINGKKTELTEEQLKALGIEMKPTRKNPFEKVVKGFTYYIINRHGDVDAYTQSDDAVDDTLLKCFNYFNDKSFANQVALHQLLYRKLLKFAYDNECKDEQEWNEMLKPTYDSTCEKTEEWSKRKPHYSVRYSYEDSTFVVFCQYDDKGQDVYFSSEKAAERAIEEVVKPFVKEHPEFVW